MESRWLWNQSRNFLRLNGITDASPAPSLVWDVSRTCRSAAERATGPRPAEELQWTETRTLERSSWTSFESLEFTCQLVKLVEPLERTVFIDKRSWKQTTEVMIAVLPFELRQLGWNPLNVQFDNPPTPTAIVTRCDSALTHPALFIFNELQHVQQMSAGMCSQSGRRGDAESSCWSEPEIRSPLRHWISIRQKTRLERLPLQQLLLRGSTAPNRRDSTSLIETQLNLLGRDIKSGYINGSVIRYVLNASTYIQHFFFKLKP